MYALLGKYLICSILWFRINILWWFSSHLWNYIIPSVLLYHQDEPVKSTCKSCPEGYFCNATFSPVVNYASTVCPEGFYCPNGTEHAEQYPCPIGTFNNRTGTYPPWGSTKETFFTNSLTLISVSWYWAPSFLKKSLCFPGLSNSSECSPCVGGWACDVTGLTSPLRLCAGGYYCKIGADSTTPAQGEYRNRYQKILDQVTAMV